METVNNPEKFSKFNFDTLKLCELTNEGKWLTSFYDDVCESTSWTVIMKNNREIKQVIF